MKNSVSDNPAVNIKDLKLAFHGYNSIDIPSLEIHSGEIILLVWRKRFGENNTVPVIVWFIEAGFGRASGSGS
ncbi:hypothetical protein [Endozoicomonas lisbonensis]|uniref:hypothetical protein n=1 Tax=Endozoicomonas lisbonensis TaxID=3120522 RepID=UPI003398CD25